MKVSEALSTNWTLPCMSPRMSEVFLLEKTFLFVSDTIKKVLILLDVEELTMVLYDGVKSADAKKKKKKKK